MKKYFIIFNLFLFVLAVKPVHAQSTQSITDLQAQIDIHTKQLQELDTQIQQYQSQIDDTSKQADTLSNTIKILNINQQKLNTEIKKTQTNISSINLSINQLGQEINNTQKKIDVGKEATAKSLRSVNQVDDISLAEIMLGSASLAQAWNEYQTSSSFNQSVSEHRTELSNYKNQVQDQQNETQKKKTQLVNLQGELKDQNSALLISKKDKNDLLVQTKNKESTYQKQLSEAKAKRDAFEKELEDYQSQLKFKLNPSSLPTTGSSPLSWPLDSILVTQLFGDTDFSRTHPGAYNGKGHNGVDFAASIGTPVKAAANGTVLGTGNTDMVCPKASYGQWVLIKHADGLTSLYAHLSIIKVSAGEQVTTGQIVGYSGNTGYTTGPHLHFGLFASAGVQIATLKSKVCSGTYTLPVSGWSAYLNPLSYLPPLP